MCHEGADLFKTISSRYMEKKLFIQLNGGRKVTGILRGYDPFMNLVVDETVEEISPAERHNIGMVVSFDLECEVELGYWKVFDI